jgi:hypothetical protein
MILDRHGLTFQDETTNNTTQSPDPFLAERQNHEPGMSYPGMPSDRRFARKGSATQGEPSRWSDTGLHPDGASILSKGSKHSVKAPYVSPHEETSHDKTPKARVIKVLGIEYTEMTLSTATIHVLIESGGREEERWLKYKQIADLSGGEEAVEIFGPS